MKRGDSRAEHNRYLAPGLVLSVLLWVLLPMHLMHSGLIQEKTHFLEMESSLQQQRTRRDEPTNGDARIIDMRDLSSTLPFDNPNGGVWTQGFDIRPRTIHSNNNNNETELTIYVVPHSHCDPGWIKTFDEYFQSQTKGILDTVVDALHKDPRRTFIWAEISYFEWWWREQPPARQELARRLVLDTKQLEFVTGGWVQPDEANTQLYAMEIQLQEGHDFIRSHFGEEAIPKYGWAIDPFGHSPTAAYLLEKYGFKGMYIQRVHYAVKKELAKRQHLEFRWRQTWDAQGTHDIFTHLNAFFCYDVPHTCGPDPSVCCQFDFARIHHYGGCPWHKAPRTITDQNVKERSLLLLDQYLKKAALYRSDTVIAPLGGDFMWRTIDEAEEQYENYQRIMDYINANVPGVRMKFGTLGDYFESAMNQIKDVPVLKGSFFTYSDVNEDYWSGYYTSRIFDKALDRLLERTLYAANSLGASKEDLQGPRRALSLFQHHDGVTGTAKDHVVRDYSARIHKAIVEAESWMINALHPGDNDFKACWQTDEPRGLRENVCSQENPVYAYNALETAQYCGDVTVPGQTMKAVKLPCERLAVSSDVKFDKKTGQMTFPLQEKWMVWKVKKGGAYLFFPGRIDSYSGANLEIKSVGLVVSTPHWNRTVIERSLSDGSGKTVRVFDFVYETFLQNLNEEWLVRFSSKISNQGVFHTDLNGFNFDTHRFRRDLPLQSQVFPMPTMASIQDHQTRLTVLSEHAQGTASLEEGSIDVWLDRRIGYDDGKGLFQGVQDNVPTRTRLRVVMQESEGFEVGGEFDVTSTERRMWDELNHPLELFGNHDPELLSSMKARAQALRQAEQQRPAERSSDSILKGGVQAQDRIIQRMQRNKLLKKPNEAKHNLK